MISSTLAQGIGLLVWTASLGLAWFAIGRRRRLPEALWIPGFVATLPIAFMLRGLLGDVSLALPAMAWYASLGAPLGSAAWRFLVALLAIAATLYASALGFLEYDLYASGYAPGLGLLLIGVAMLAAYRWMPVLAWCWLLGLGLSATRLHPSPNLWDAMIDLPTVCLAAFIVLRFRVSGPDADAGGCLSACKAPSDSNRRAAD
jgi:hypothetical protein